MSSPPLSRLQRHLGLRPGQGLPLALLGAQSALLGIALICFYGVANARFLDVWEPADLPWTYIAAAVVVTAASLGFAGAERRLGLRIAASGSLALLALIGALQWWGLRQAPRAPALAFIGPVDFRLLWVLGNLALWSQVNAVFDIQQVKRLTPPLILAFVTGVLGYGLLSGVAVAALGSTNLVGLVAGVLGVVALVAGLVPTGERPAKGEVATAPERLPRAALGFVIVLLVYDAISTFAAYVVDYAFLSAVDQRFPDPDASAVFLGRYMGGMTLAVVVVTALLAGPVMRRWGVKGSLLANPASVGLAAVSALGALLLGAPDLLIFALVVLAKGANETAVPTFTGPGVRVAVLALPPSHQVRALSWYDGVVAPLAIGLTGVGLLVVQRLGVVGLRESLGLLAILLVAWVPLTFAVGRAYPRAVRERLGGGPAALDRARRIVAGQEDGDRALAVELLQTEGALTDDASPR